MVPEPDVDVRLESLTYKASHTSHEMRKLFFGRSDVCKLAGIPETACR
jgi:hypothetical protein